MKWLTRLRVTLGYDEPSSTPPVGNDIRHAQDAYASAEKALAESRRVKTELHMVSNSLATLRARNHFGENIHVAMMRREN